MATNENPLNDIPDDVLESRLLNRSIAGFRDLQYTYGVLETLSWSGDDEDGKFYTPEASDQFLGKDNSAIIVELYADNNEFEFHDAYTDTLDRDLVAKSAPAITSGWGKDTSLTHKTGKGMTPEKIGGRVDLILRAWAGDQKPIRDFANLSEDGDFITNLTQFGEEHGKDIAKEVAKRMPDKVGGFLIFRFGFRNEPTIDVEESNGVEQDGATWYYPTDIPVLTGPIKETAKNHLTNRSELDDSSGNGICAVTGEEGTVYGGVEDPMNMYRPKQAGTFPEFDYNRAWKTQSISLDAALAINSSEQLLDACRIVINGNIVYLFPYFVGELTADDARNLYEILNGLASVEDNNSDTNPLLEAYGELLGGSEEYERLRFWVLGVEEQQRSRYNFRYEIDGVTDYTPRNIRSYHDALNQHMADSSYGLANPENGYGVFNPAGLPKRILSGQYFIDTFYPYNDDERPSDDPRFTATQRIVSGDSVEVETLLHEYVTRINNLTEDNPLNHGIEYTTQFYQMQALATGGFLSTNANNTLLTQPPRYMTESKPTYDTEISDDMTNTEKRAIALEHFIEDHPAIRDNDERKAAFLLGAYLGHISLHQERDGKTGTLAKQYPPKTLSENKVKRVWNEAVTKNQQYTSSSDTATSLMFKEVSSRLADVLNKKLPENWDLSSEDIRFHYGLGIAYANNSPY